MKSKTIVQVLLVVILLLGTAWLLRGKVALLSPRLADRIAAWKNPPPPPEESGIGPDGEHVAIEPPKLEQPPAADLAPLPAKTKPLASAPTLPRLKAPVLVLAPWHGPSDSQTSSADLLEVMFRTHIRATPKDRLLVNLVPNDAMRQLFYRENGDWTVKGHGHDAYLDNARRLNADHFVWAVVGDSGRVPTVQLVMTDLRNSRTVQWDSSSVAGTSASIANLLRETVSAAGKFCGISHAEMESGGMFRGLPSDETWQTMLQSRERDEYLFTTLIQQDPECVYLYEYAWSKKEPTRYVDRGLQRWPDDPRLLRQKAIIHEDSGKRTAAWIIRSELMRRYPDNLILAHEAANAISAIFDDSDKATEAPPAWLATLAYLKQQTERFPKNWIVQWDYANGANALASYIRGDKRANEIPESTWRHRDKLNNEAVLAINRAIELQPRSSEMLRASMHINWTAGFSDPKWQKELIATIHQIDPSNVRAEMMAAFSHSIGWGSFEDYWDFIQLAMKNHRGDARAMHHIAWYVGTELRRQIGWKAMTPQEVYGKPNPMSDVFIECAEYAMNHGVQVDKFVAGMLREMYRERYGEAKVQELAESGKHWALTAEAAQKAHDAGDWERTLRLARLAEPKARPYMTNGRVQYYVVKALWKLGRHDEALREARDGILRYPDEQTFHYMFAVVANEKGAPLEEAYERAYRAVDILTTNTGANETFESIRKKLNKPPHPKLKK